MNPCKSDFQFGSVINKYSHVCVCNQHVLMKAKVSEFSVQCSFIFSYSQHYKKTSKVSKANLLSKALLVRGSGQKD